jgi:hypothetical protein
MALSSLASLKLYMGIASGNTTLDSQLTAMLSAADAAVKSYCQRDLESQDYTHYFDGNGQRDLVLRQWPVTAITSVYQDATGFYGDGPSAFASTTLLTNGTHYALRKDQGTASYRGLLRRIAGGGISAADPFFPRTQTTGSLVGGIGPVWPRGDGNIKVVYTAGYTSIPADLTQATNQLAAYAFNNADWGGMQATGESLDRYSYTLAAEALNGSWAALGTTRSLLAPYRELGAI